MRSELWLWLVYFAIVIAVIGGIYIRYRRRQARLDGVSERAAMLTPRPRTAGDTIDPMRARPLVSTVYWSKEAIKEKIIAEYDATRTTVLRRLPVDQDMLRRITSVARSIGRNDWLVEHEQDHEPDMSQDFDINHCGPLRLITSAPEDSQVDSDNDVA